MESKKYELGKNVMKAVEKTLGLNLNPDNAIIESLEIYCDNGNENPNRVKIKYEVF